MARRARYFIALAAMGVSLSAINLPTAVAAPPTQGGDCVDHSDNGEGNGGDPGNGREHHNEDQGSGNGTDPGNGQGHFCTTE